MAREVDERLADLFEKNMEIAIDKIAIIKDVVKTFNGKVFNRRFENAITETLNKGVAPDDTLNLDVELDYKHFYIDLCFYNYKQRSTSGDTCACAYLPRSFEKIRITPYCYTDYNDWDTSKNGKYHERQEDCHFWIDINYNTRLNADYICRKLDEGKKDLRERLTRFQNDRKNVDTHMQKLEAIKKEIEELHASMCSDVRYMYGVKDYATWSN